MTRVSDPIIAMRVHVLRMPTLATHAHGIGDVSSFDTVILELKTSSGITGWGEASPWPVFTGTVEASVAALHVFMRPYLMGADPCLVEKHLAAMDRMVVNCTEAKAAVEMALLDIMGKMSGLSVGDLIGGRCHDAIPLSFSVANPNYDLDRETVKEFYARNIRIYKLKAGFASHEFDVMRLQDLRNTYGSEIDLRVDYNQGMHAYEAIRRLKDLERFDLTFIEQPVPRTNIEAMARITQAIDTPILADESVFGPRDALTVVKMQAADLFSLKIMKSGGIRRGLEVAGIARAAGIGVYGGCMLETGIAHMAGLHMMSVIPDLTLGCEFYMPTCFLVEDILAHPFPEVDGKIQVPTSPGLGVEVDMERLARYRTRLWE